MEEPSKKLPPPHQPPQPTQQSRLQFLLSTYQHSIHNPSPKPPTPHQKSSSSSYLLQTTCQKWLHQKGKTYLLDFNQQQRSKLKTFFNTLDKKKSGSIPIDQLQQMLLSLGLSNNLEQITKLIQNIDQNHTGKIQFQQFLSMIQDDTQENQKIVQFFRQLILTQLKYKSQHNSGNDKNNYLNIHHSTPSQKQLFSNKISFEMIVNLIRRNHILSSMNIGRCKTINNHKTLNKINKGKQVVKALQKMDEKKLMKQLRENQQKNKQNYQQSNKQKIKDTVGGNKRFSEI